LKFFFSLTQGSSRVMRWMVMTGIALSVASLTIALAVTAGFEKDYKNALLNFNAHILILPSEEQTLTKESIEKGFQEAKIPDVQLLSVSPYLYREALLIHEGKLKGVILKGTSSEKFQIPNPKFQINSKSQVPNKSEIVLGKALAQNLNFDSTKQDSIKVLIPLGKEVSAKNTKRLVVGSTFQSGLYEFDSQFALMNLQDLQQLFNLSPSFHGFELRIDQPEMAPFVKIALEKTLGDNVGIQDWVEINSDLFQALQMEKWVFRIIMGLMIFVSSLNLIGAVLLNVFRRRKTIAILQALGLSPFQIRQLFTTQGFLLGAIGILSGLVLGLCIVSGLNRFHWVSLDPQIYFLEKLPVSVEPFTIFIIALASLLLVWQTSWIAAGRALTIPIREGLHGP